MEKNVTAEPITEPSAPTAHDDRLVGATRTSHRIAGATGVLMLVALLGLLGIGGADPAQAAPAPGAPTITLTSAQGDGSVQLTATLTGPDGKPQADAPVTFSFSTTQFGSPARLVPVGSVTTDAAGSAAFILGGDADHLYKPTATGPQQFNATYAPAAGAKPVTASTTVNVQVARSAYTPTPPKPLARVGNVLVIALFAIVAAIWLTLGAQVWRVRRVCRSVPEPTISSA